MLIQNVVLLAQVVLDQPGNLNPDDIIQLVGTVVQAVQNGGGLLAIAPAILAVIWFLRRFVIPSFSAKLPFLADKRFTLTLSIAVPVLTTVGAALITGAPLTFGLVASAVLSGLAAVGLYSGQKNWKEGVAAAKVPQPSPEVASKMSAVIGGRPLK